MIIECSYCDSKVDGKLVGEAPLPTDDYPFAIKVALLTCPVCKKPLLGLAEEADTGGGEFQWDELVRQWPVPETDVPWNIPEIVKISLVEAKLCFKAKAYAACAVMCGRALEGICKNHDPKGRNLAGGLRKLKDDGIIDSRLYDWGEALRVHRNLGAHASTERVKRDDARDLVDFCGAICEYIYVLNEKFNKFMERQGRQV